MLTEEDQLPAAEESEGCEREGGEGNNLQRDGRWEVQEEGQGESEGARR